MNGQLRPLTRGAATTPALSLSLVILIATLAWLGAAAPGFLADGRTATVQRAVTQVPALGAWPSATIPGLPATSRSGDADGGVWSGALAALEQKRREQPQPLGALLGAPRMVVALDPLPTTADRASGDSTSGDSTSGAVVPLNKVALVSDPGFSARAELVTGRLPQRTEPVDGLEVALTATVAEQLRWEVGDARQWDDLTVTLTGIVSPSGHGDDDWSFISGSATPVIEVDGGGNRIIVGAAFLHPDQAASFADRGRNVKVTAWMPFDTGGIDAASARTAAAQLRLLAADPARIPMRDRIFADDRLAYRSTLPQAIDAGLARADAMTPVFTVATMGPAAAALVVIALLSRVIAMRRVETTRMLRARGASIARLIALLAGEGAALGVIGAAIGAGVASVLPGWSGAQSLPLPMLFAAVPAVALPWTALKDAARRGRGDLGDAGRSRTARTAFETLIVVVTAALAVLVAVRADAGGADPVVLALFVLLGVTGGILSLRLLPVLLRFAERLGERSTSLTALLGPARARRDPAIRVAPVLAVVIGVGVAVFATAFSATVSAGIVRSTALEVGADMRIDAPHITDAGAQRVVDLDGVTETAAVRGGTTVQATAGGQKERVRVYLVDRDELAAVQGDIAGALELPAALSEPSDIGVPVVISQRLHALLGGEDLRIGGEPVEVVGVARSRIPFGSAEQWVIVDAAHDGVLDRRTTGPAQLYLSLDPAADPDAVGVAVTAALGDGVVIDTPARVAAVHASDPAHGIVQAALLTASAITAGLLAVAVIATLMLGAPSRARMLAILRTLGHPHRAGRGLVTWELAPALLLSLLFGAGAGIAMVLLVIPQLDLRGFVGAQVQPPVVLEALPLLVAIAGFAVAAAVAVVVASTIASRLDASVAVRTDDEHTP